MKIKITTENYLKVWLKLMLLKLHVDISDKELEVLEHVCKLRLVSTAERKIISKQIGTSYQVVSNTLKSLKDKGLIDIKKDGTKNYNGRSYYYKSNITYPPSIQKMLEWKDSLIFEINT